MADVRGPGPVLAVPAVVDHQHSRIVRRGRRIGQQQLQPPGIHLVSIPPRLGQEELQPLHRRMLRPRDRLGPGQRGQRLVPVPRRQQPGQVLPEPPPLRQRPEQVIKPGRILFQRPRRRRTRHTSGHYALPGTSCRSLLVIPRIPSEINKLPLEAISLDDQELGDVCTFLAGEGLIKKGGGLWGHYTPYTITITHKGIKEMEQSLQAPTEPTQHFPPAISVIHIEGSVIGSAIQSGSPSAQQEMTAGDTEETLPSEPKSGHPWKLILIVVVSGVGAAITALLGISRLDWWSLALVVFVAGAVLAAVTYATEEKHRTLALWISTGLCGALLIGIAVYYFIGPSPAQTANVVANEIVGLSCEAGVSAAKEPCAVDTDGQPYVFDKGAAETAACYTMVGSSVWLYFHFGPGDSGWAPFSEFHYQRGFSEQLPSHC